MVEHATIGDFLDSVGSVSRCPPEQEWVTLLGWDVAKNRLACRSTMTIKERCDTAIRGVDVVPMEVSVRPVVKHGLYNISITSVTRVTSPTEHHLKVVSTAPSPTAAWGNVNNGASVGQTRSG